MRIKRAVNAHKKRRSILFQAKGYKGARSRSYKRAKEQLLHSGVYAFRDRKKRKTDFRQLWISRINGAVRSHGLKYSTFINGLSKTDINLNRKSLAEIAMNDSENFNNIVEKVKVNIK